MAKFRIALGILLLLLGPTLFFIFLNAEQSGINMAEPDGTRGAALFDLLGKWGILGVCVIFGISEVMTGKALLRDNPAVKNKTPHDDTK
jgi:hypothetical protein